MTVTKDQLGEQMTLLELPIEINMRGYLHVQGRPTFTHAQHTSVWLYNKESFNCVPIGAYILFSSLLSLF